ncbi:MAG: integrase arm-type DNA-binding domain-containing protein, partial [Nitrospirae bacterium]|nr:integrase arm-type DNA-binding domain-containing protein [Nitrospirota bacterium]
MPLTDIAIRNAKPAEKSYKLFDSGGLYLIVSTRGGKWWRLKYRYDRDEKSLSLGVYPDVSLKDARERRDEARKLLANEIDPGENRKATKASKVERAANSFEVVAREWFAKHSPNWAESHASRIIRRLERDMFPWIGGKPIADITAPQLLEASRRIEQRGALETAHRALGNCGQVFRYAVATGRAVRDPSGDLRGALPSAKGKHFASVTEPTQVAELLRALDGYEGTLTVCGALRLAPLVFVRPGELRHAQWADIDLDAAEWRYIVTKTDTQHIVPLSTQAVEILRELHPLTGRGRYVFPSARGAVRPMSD